MSRNYQLHALFADEARSADNAAEHAEMRAQGLSTIDRDPPRRASGFSCEGCFQTWHEDEVDFHDDPKGWLCPACDTFHDL